MGWRSQEQSYNFDQRSKSKGKGKQKEVTEEDDPSWKKQRPEYTPGEVPEGLPDRFFDEEGQVNLSKVNSRDALQYMSAQGIKIPMMGRR